MMKTLRGVPLTSCAMILVLSLAVASSGMAEEGPCTEQTCSGPVQVTFSGHGCETSPTRTQLLPNVSMIGVCEPAGAYEWISRTCEEGRYTRTWYSDPSCTSVNRVIVRSTGQCVNYASSSMLYLCSVNDTFTEPGVADSSLTYLESSQFACSSPNECGENVTIYTTIYESDTCDSSNATLSYGYQAGQNFSVGGCFYVPATLSTQKITCNEQYLQTDLYQDGACGGTPFATYLDSRSCVYKQLGKRDSLDGPSYSRIFCSVSTDPTPSPPTPSSAPSSAAAWTLMGLMGLIALAL
jgi:hypothetical protein